MMDTTLYRIKVEGSIDDFLKENNIDKAQITLLTGYAKVFDIYINFQKARSLVGTFSVDEVPEEVAPRDIDYVVKTLSSTPATSQDTTHAYEVVDPSFSDWAKKSIHSRTLEGRSNPGVSTRNGEGVDIYIVDTQVNLKHPEFTEIPGRVVTVNEGLTNSRYSGWNTSNISSIIKPVPYICSYARWRSYTCRNS